MCSISVYKRTSTTMPVNLLCPRTTLIFALSFPPLPGNGELFFAAFIERDSRAGSYRARRAINKYKSVGVLRKRRPVWMRRMSGKKLFAENSALKFFLDNCPVGRASLRFPIGATRVHSSTVMSKHARRRFYFECNVIERWSHFCDSKRGITFWESLSCLAMTRRNYSTQYQ